ncbi:hypothetical protein [Streptomyces longisporus]|uniref:Uncharacterized protein n=1 Tax=Streptomyces longisporus TaxID=1948 RepID=A0ABP5Z0U4_STRLO
MASGGGATVLTGAYPKVVAGGADAHDGTSKFLAYHYYDGDNSGRETLGIRQVTFANGWPVLAGTQRCEQPPAEPQQRQVRARLVAVHGGRGQR